MLGAERLGRALGVNLGADLIKPDVTPFRHRRVDSRVATYEDRLQIFQLAHRSVDLGLDRGRLALTPRPVGNEDRLGLRDLHPFAHRFRRKAAEDNVVRRANPRAGQHCDDDLRDHWQVNADDVAGADAAGLQRVSGPLNVSKQLRVGDVALLSLFAKPVEGNAVPEAGINVAVEAVVGGVELAILKPLVERSGRVVERFRERLEPFEL